MLTRDELQNMQNKPMSVHTTSDQGQGQYDAQTMNNFYLQFMQMQQQMMQPPQSWDMNSPNSDSYSVQQNRSSKYGKLSPPKTNSFFTDHYSEGMNNFDFNQAQGPVDPLFTSNRFSDGSNLEILEDDWSTRPRAKNHLSLLDIRNLQNPDMGDKKSGRAAFASGFEINIRNVEDMLDDDLQNGRLSGSNNLDGAQKSSLSAENSAFNSGFGNKQYSVWSDTMGSKLNKTKTTRESTGIPLKRSFGDSTKNEQADLTTIFETKDGPFFAWDEPPLSTKKEELFEGFQIIDVPQVKKLKVPFRSQVNRPNPKADQLFKSNLTGDYEPLGLFPIVSKGSEEERRRTDKFKSNSEL